MTGDGPRGKECLNLAMLLSELYNFQVISCVLVYDVIRGLLDTLNEFDVELLLKIARSMYLFYRVARRMLRVLTYIVVRFRTTITS